MRPQPAGRRFRHRVTAALVLSALLIVATALAIALFDDPTRGIAADPPRGLVYGLLGWSSVAAVLLLRRRAPGPGTAVAGALSMTAAVLQPVPPFALLPFGIAIVVAMVSGAAVWALASVGAAYAVSLTAVFVSDSAVTATRGFGTMAILLLALGVGAFLRTRRIRAVEEERRRADQQRTAIEEERLRIARELHDVLAHSLSSITVQAGVGLHLATDRPEAATEALEMIRAASREALDEVRGVLGLLRGDESAPLTPGPDLDALAALVEDTRRTGARVLLEDGLQPRPSTPVQRAVYRVVQEALTNARRHAPGAQVDIVLERRTDAVTATVRNRGTGPRPAAPVDGNGITGMRERATALGGTLDLRTHDDGLEVLLRIPEGPA